MKMQTFKLEKYCRSHLPLAIWDEKIISRRQVVHTHDCIEMVFIYGGAGICAINDIHYPMLAGDIYIILPGSTHEYTTDIKLQFINIMFARSLFSADEMIIYERLNELHKLKRKAIGAEPKYTFPLSAIGFITGLLRQMEHELKTHSEYFEYNVKALFMQFLINLLRNIDSAQGISARNNQMNISRIFNYIANHYQEKITLEKLAAITGNSPVYLGKQFKRLAGINVSEYICRYRIEKARNELENSEDSIAEIADRLGFFDTSYFIKSFQRYCGVTPSQYRKSH